MSIMAINQKYTTICTKLSLTDRTKLSMIAKKLKLSDYELLQSILLVLVRYFDNPIEISEEHKNLVKELFDILETKNDSYSPLSLRGSETTIFDKAIVFVKRKNCNLPQMVLINKNENGIFESYNFDDMLTAFLEVSAPGIIKILDKEIAYNGCFSKLQALKKIVYDRQVDDDDIMHLEIADMFSEQKTDFGDEINDDVFYLQKKNRGDEGNFAGQRRITEVNIQ